MSAPRRAPIWLVLVAASLPMFMATLDNLVITNALPVMGRELGASIEELQWFINAFTLAFASFILMAVRTRRPLRAPHGVRRRHRGLHRRDRARGAQHRARGMLIVARAVQGLGAARSCRCRSPCSRAPSPSGAPARDRHLGRRLRPRRRLGPLIGGAFVEGWNWQAIFWINVPVGILAIPLVLLALPNTFGARVRVDVAGSCSPASACSASSSASCAATTRAGTASRCRLARSPAPRCSWAFVAWESRTTRRCCRCGCSATAASRSRMSSGSGSASGSSGRSSSSSSSSRSFRAVAARGRRA